MSNAVRFVTAPFRSPLLALRRHTARHYRWAIYALLLALIAASIALSLVMEQTATAIRRDAEPLLRQTIPQLRYLSNFDSAALRYQLSLDNLYTESISPQRFEMLEPTVRAELERARADGTLPRFGNPNPSGPGGVPSSPKTEFDSK